MATRDAFRTHGPLKVDDTSGALLTRSDCTGFTGDIKVVAASATGEPLVAASTPCQFVWIGAPVDSDGVAQNTKPAFIAESAAKAVAAEGAIPLMPSNFEGMTIQIDDASKLYVGVGVNGEGVAYRIFV